MSTNFAIIGAGRIANVHASALRANPDADLVAVADALPGAAEAFAEKWGCVARDVAAIAADPEIAAVLICTPTDTHANLIETFGKAGKHTFCEKPIDLDTARAREAMAAAEGTGAKLMLGFNRRFDPHFRAVREAIDAGRIGAVEMDHLARPRCARPRLCFALWRNLSRHDDPRSRHGALPPRRGARGGNSSCGGPG